VNISYKEATAVYRWRFKILFWTLYCGNNCTAYKI